MVPAEVRLQLRAEFVGRLPRAATADDYRTSPENQIHVPGATRRAAAVQRVDAGFPSYGAAVARRLRMPSPVCATIGTSSGARYIPLCAFRTMPPAPSTNLRSASPSYGWQAMSTAERRLPTIPAKPRQWARTISGRELRMATPARSPSYATVARRRQTTASTTNPIARSLAQSSVPSHRPGIPSHQ
jgi:hypothetical protein